MITLCGIRNTCEGTTTTTNQWRSAGSLLGLINTKFSFVESLLDSQTSTWFFKTSLYLTNSFIKRRFSLLGSLNKETTFAYLYTWLAQSIKIDLRKSIVSAIVFNYFNDIIDCFPGSKPNNNMQMFSVLNDDFISHFFHVLWSCYFSFHLVADLIIFFVSE